MPSRAELNLRAFAVGLDPATYYNDSKLEQKILFMEKNTYAVTGTVPTTTLTSSGTAGDGETLTIGSKTYTMKTALTGVLASATLTASGTPSDGDFVQIGSYRYVFKTTLDTGAALVNFLSGSINKWQVLINGSAANALTNLKAAINASGTGGTDYSSAVVAAQYFTGSTLTSSTLVVAATAAGTPNYLGYLIGTTASGANLSWSAPNLTGGVNPVANEILIGSAATNSLDNIKDAINGTVVSGARDVTVSSPTLRHPRVTASTKTATTLLINSTDKNTAGTLATTETMANFAFTGGTMGSGVLSAIAVAGDGVTDSVAGVSGDANTAL